MIPAPSTIGANRSASDNKLSLCGCGSCGQADGVKGAMEFFAKGNVMLIISPSAVRRRPRSLRSRISSCTRQSRRWTRRPARKRARAHAVRSNGWAAATWRPLASWSRSHEQGQPATTPRKSSGDPCLTVTPFLDERNRVARSGSLGKIRRRPVQRFGDLPEPRLVELHRREPVELLEAHDERPPPVRVDAARGKPFHEIKTRLVLQRPKLRYSYGALQAIAVL